MTKGSTLVGISLDWHIRRIGVQKVRYSGKYGHSGGTYERWTDVDGLIIITCDYKGIITLSKLLGNIKLPLEKWLNNPTIQEEALGKAYKRPKTHLITGRNNYNPPWHEMGKPGSCLPGNSLISTPDGFVPIKNLQVGDFIWTVDRFGQRIQTPIIQKVKRPAARNHKMAHVILKDGRELVASLGHPTIDNMSIGSLLEGEFLDGSEVSSLKIIPYKGQHTYDILPYGETGAYWANGIFIGSTLSYQSQKMENQKYPSSVYYASWL